MAARIGDQFKLDPIAVLNDDRWNSLIRSAAYAIIQKDRKAAQEQAKKQ